MTLNDQLADLLVQWEEARDSGEPVSAEELCRETPETLIPFRDLLHRLGIAQLITPAQSTETNEQDAPSGIQAGRYATKTFHAAGGLGFVYRARDEEMNRDIALKCLKQPAAADSLIGRRFYQEAEITSRLEHPAIVPVHGRGMTNDGRPYYAMRFIEGETLDDAVKRFHQSAATPSEKSLEFRRLLRVFVNVCEAVAYAHSRGIVHRDLKPANIMLGPYGEALVLDWGLAADQTGDDLTASKATATTNSALTQQGRAKGSPAFMSPEQAHGDWSRVGPLSDIFSLGATLYYLLVGSLPFEGHSALQVVERVRVGKFRTPRQINTAIPRPLDAICCQAIAYEPAARYGSAKEFAADLERFLADEPVKAWAEPFSVRARRWVRQHRTLVSASVVGLLVATIILAISGYRLEQQNRALDRSNVALSEANQREVALRERAETGEAEAISKKQLAEDRFRIALDATNTLVTDLQTKLSQTPATRVVRESLLKEALVRLEKLLAKAESTTEADRSMMLAHVRLGELYSELDQSPSRAVVEFQRASEMARVLNALPLRNRATADDELFVIDLLARAQNLLGHSRQAEASATRGDEIIRTLSGDIKQAQARFTELRAALSLSNGDAATAFRLYSVAADFWKQRLQAQKKITDEREYALLLLNLGKAAEIAGRLPEGREIYSQSKAIWLRLLAQNPNDIPAKRKLAQAYDGLGQIDARNRNFDEMEKNYQAFYDLILPLTEQDPANASDQLELQIALGGLANAAAAQNNFSRGEELFKKSITIADKIAKLDPSNLNSQQNLAIASYKLAAIEYRRPQNGAWIEPLTRAIKICEQILAIAPTRSETRAYRSQWLSELGENRRRFTSDKALALSNVKESLDEWQRLTEIDSTNLRWQHELLLAHARFARLLAEPGKPADDAEATVRKGLLAAEAIAPLDRDVASIRDAISDLRWMLAINCFERKNMEEGHQILATEIASLQDYSRRFPDREVGWRATINLLATQAVWYGRTDQPLLQQSNLQQAIKTAQQAMAAMPSNEIFPESLLNLTAQFAIALLPFDPKQALVRCQETIALVPANTGASITHSTSLAAVHSKAGDCCDELGQYPEGIKHYEKARELHQRINELQPNSAATLGILAYDHKRIADLELARMNYANAKGSLEKASELIASMKKQKLPFRPLDARTASQVEAYLPFVSSLPGGIDTLEKAANQPESIRFLALRTRVKRLIEHKDFDEAIRTAERIAQFPPRNGEAFVVAASEIARLAKYATADSEKLRKRAIELLQQGKKLGYFKKSADLARLGWEPSFETIRGEKAFQELMATQLKKN